MTSHVSKRSSRLVLAAALATALAPLDPASATSSGRIRVVPHATVVGPTARVSDVAAPEGDATRLAEVEVATGLAPGEARRVGGQMLLGRLREAGLDDSIGYTIPASVTVTRAFQSLGEADLQPEVEARLDERLAPGDRLEAFELAKPMRIPLGSYRVEVGELGERRTGAGYRSLELRVVQDDGEVTTATARVKIATFGPVVVMRQPVERGAVLRAEDLRIEERRLDELPGAVVADIDEVVGKQARVALAAGRALTNQALANASLIRRGDVVRVVVEHDRLRLSASGEALDDGGVGERVRVVNAGSGRELTGRVIDHGTVLVAY
jgi:flagella basal body P-ring formation protein FlgA